MCRRCAASSIARRRGRRARPKWPRRPRGSCVDSLRPGHPAWPSLYSSRGRRMRDATRVRAALGCRGVCRTPCGLSTSRAPPASDGPCYTPAHRTSRTGRSLMHRLVSLLAVLAVLLLPTGAPPTPAQQKTLVVTGYGGRWSEVMKKALIDPFEKQHGVKIELVTGITTEWVAKLMAAGPDNPPFDVVMGNEPPFPI